MQTGIGRRIPPLRILTIPTFILLSADTVEGVFPLAILNWLHLSDWHERGPDFDRKVVREALLKDIRNHAAISEDLKQIDLVFFTGDLAFSGQEKEYTTARKKLLEPVLEAVGLSKDRLFIIPGNHDIDRNALEFLPEQLTRPAENEEQVKNWLTHDRWRSKLLEPFEEYHKFVQAWGVPGFDWYAGCHVITVNGKEVGILGCNSALMCGRKTNDKGEVDDERFLFVGEPQIYDHLDKLAAADVRIGLIHHPFDWLAGFERNVIGRRMREGCQVILRGHEHIPSVEVVKGTAGSATIIPAGASYDGRIPGRPIYANAYNFVHYDTDTMQGTVHLRRWSDARNVWIKDTDTADEGKFSFSTGTPPPLPSPPITPHTVNPQ